MSVATVAGEELNLDHDCAAFLLRTRTLLIADPHFAKAASFRASGVYVPAGTTQRALARLDILVDRYEPTRIVFLGDFLHAKEGRNEETFRLLTEWRTRHARIHMLLVRGNHDKRAGDPPCEVGITCVDGPVVESPFVFAHHPVEDERGYVLAGHIHPCAVLLGKAKQRIRLPCFHFGERVGVLPAFGEFTGCAEIDVAAQDEVWVIAESEVVQFSAANHSAGSPR